MNTNLIQTPELGRNESDDEDRLKFDADDLTKKISAIKPKYNKLINKDSYFIDDEEVNNASLFTVVFIILKLTQSIFRTMMTSCWRILIPLVTIPSMIIKLTTIQ